MKKFSKITNQKVGEEPKVEQKPITEEDIFKSSVLNLIENTLTIRTYGPVDRYLREGSIKIAGKEMFVDALIDLIVERTSKDKVKILESLKSSISDWEALDKGIEEAKLYESTRGKMLNHRMKITNLFRLYKDDRDSMYRQIDEMVKRTTNGERAYHRAMAAEQMATENEFPKTVLKDIAQKFYFRAKQLGYNDFGNKFH